MKDHKPKPEETSLNEADKLVLEKGCYRLSYPGEYPDYPILETLFIKKGRITKADIKKLSPEERAAFNYAVNEKLYSKWGKDRDCLIEKIQDVISDESKLNRWNIEHIDIKVAISEFVKDCNRMPSIHELAKRTGFSAKTIRKHLIEYESHQNHLEQQQLFKIMGEKILAKVAKFAIEGDVKAARLYFDVVSGLNANSARTEINTTINTQNNHLQVNGKIISQRAIMNLPMEQQKQLETIFALNP